MEETKEEDEKEATRVIMEGKERGKENVEEKSGR